jgi:hypothetical protein
VIVSELKDALGCGKVLQAVLAQIAEPIAIQERSGRCGYQDLAAMSAGRDPSGSVHINADVALLGQVGRPGMKTHAHPDRTPSQSFLRSGGRAQRTGRRGERNEEGIALRVDLDPAVGAERVAQDATVFRECVRVLSVASLMQKSCRTLYVSEEEGDRS